MADQPCVCAHPVELRPQTEVQGEIDHLYALLALRLKKAGKAEEAEAVLGVARERRLRVDTGFRRKTEPAAETASA